MQGPTQSLRQIASNLQVNPLSSQFSEEGVMLARCRLRRDRKHEEQLECGEIETARQHGQLGPDADLRGCPFPLTLELVTDSGCRVHQFRTICRLERSP